MERRNAADIRLAVSGNAVARRGGVWHTHHSFGRIVDLLAQRFAEVHYHGPQAPDKTADMCDFPLDRPNIAVWPGDQRLNTLAALRRPWRVVGEYRRLIRGADVLLLRGNLPLAWTAHLLARRYRRPTVHWLTGNAVAVLRGAQRGYGGARQFLGVQYARLEQGMTRMAMRLSRAHALANGAELAAIFPGPRTHVVVSTSISDGDFRERVDTCAGPELRILFVGFVRPEKGIEYLLRAMPLLRCDRPLRLAIVGSWGQFSGEHDRLCGLIRELGLAGRVDWEGYAEFGPALFAQMDRSDMLVLPTLSEGTPRVLVEARARSLPIVATRVGGIPSSVADGHDGLLVPPRDHEALAAAMNRILSDAELRRGLIVRGRQRVRELTVERFADMVTNLLTEPG